MMKRQVNRSAISSIAIATAILIQAGPVSAQEDGDGEGGTIIVTGSRLGRDSFNAPTPVAVVGAERMEDLAINNVADALNQLPSFRPITSPGMNNFRPGSNIAARTLDLRGLGSTRTLVLLDGRRSVPSTEEGRFDLNSLPSIMIQRSEVVTGGASAAYGADAVAGVVNLILDTHMTGIKADANFAISELGDAERVTAAGMYGTSFADGRGHIVVGGEYSSENGVGAPRDRKWSAKFHGFIANPFWKSTGGNTNPQHMSLDNVLFVLNPGGIVVNGPLQGLQFNEDSNLVPFTFGTFFNPASPSIQMVGGDASVQDLYGCSDCPLFVANSHISTLGHLEYELTSSVTLNAELAYSSVTGGPTQGAIALNNFNASPALVVRRDNAFLTPQVAALMDARNVTSFNVARSHQEYGTTRTVSHNHTLRSVLALSGSLANDWDWDAFYTYGRTHGRMQGDNIRRDDRFYQSVDAVFAPAGNTAGIPAGTIVCRSTLTNPGNGCIPTNFMGAGTLNDAALAWTVGTYGQTRRFSQHAAAANLRGTALQNWAGDVTFATGFEYRVDHSEGAIDPLTASTNPVVFIAKSATVLPAQTQKVKEGYLEVGIPVIAESSFGSINLDGAVRYTDYSISGNAWTWKGGAVWDISDSLMLRVTRSHDIRAPNALELNPNQSSNPFPLNDPKYNVSYQILSKFGGNPDLKLEKANTFTVGGVFQPGFVPNLRLSLDYYDIQVNSAIDTISNTVAVILCRQGNTAVCTIGTDSFGNQDRILELRSTYQNVNTVKARGFEGVLSYAHELDDRNTLNLNVNANLVEQLDTELPSASGTTVRKFLGYTGNFGSITNLAGVPKWRTAAVLTLENPLFSLTASGRYIPASLLSNDHIGPHQDGYSVDWVATPADPRQSISNNRVTDRFYLDISGSVKLYGPEGEDGVELFASVSNVFNTNPPGNLRFLGNALYYDPLGRFYKMGVRVAL